MRPERPVVSGGTGHGRQEALAARSGGDSSARPPGRILALDGLRALAVMAVMAFHTGSEPLPGGFLGVDVFFVLSGFLISGILISQWRQVGRIRAAEFWLRRARRLAPALLLLLCAVAATRLLVVQPTAQTWRAPLLAAATYTTNWYEIWTGHDYFGQFAAPSPLLHTWSLAIEEQFYIGFAVLLIVALPRLRSRSPVPLLASLAAVSAVLMVWYASHDPTWAYYSTLSRGQALLIGAAVGAALEAGWLPRSGAAARLGGWVGLGGLLVLFIAPVGTEVMFRGGFTLAALFSGLLVLGLLGDGLLASVFSWRPLVLLGLISYGIYLWHWPVFLWLGSGQADSSAPRQVWAVTVTVAISVASYVLLERPVRQGSFTRLPVSGQWTAYLLATLVVVVLSLLPARTAADSVRSQAPWPVASAVPQRIAVAGDSTMLRLGDGFPTDVYPGRVVAGPTTVACGLVNADFWRPGLQVDTRRCWGWPEDWRDSLDQMSPDVVVVGSLVWDLYDRVSENGPKGPGEPEFDRPFRSAFRQAAELASAHGSVPVYVLGIPCMHAELDAEVLDDPLRRGRTNDLIRQALTGLTNVHYVDLEPLTCRSDGTAVVHQDGRLLRDDGVHWTPAGAREVWSLLLARMAADGVAASDTPTMTP